MGKQQTADEYFLRYKDSHGKPIKTHMPKSRVLHMIKNNQLDALLFPGVSSAGIGARPGYPTVTVPYAFVPVTGGTGAAAFPTGFEPKPAPFNVSFTGLACSEPKLIELAYAFEQVTKKRTPPSLFP